MWVGYNRTYLLFSRRDDHTAIVGRYTRMGIQCQPAYFGRGFRGPADVSHGREDSGSIEEDRR